MPVLGGRVKGQDMKTKEIIKRASDLAKPFRVTNGDTFRLKDFKPGDTLGFKSEDKERAKEVLASGVQMLAELQDKLYAQDRWAVLVVFQAMDAAGNSLTTTGDPGFGDISNHNLTYGIPRACLQSKPTRLEHLLGQARRQQKL